MEKTTPLQNPAGGECLRPGLLRTPGVRPTRIRAPGEGAAIRFSIGRCSLGGILVAASSKGVCAIFLGDDPRALAREIQRRFKGAEPANADLEFERLAARAIDCVDSPGSNMSLQLDIKGTPFQQRVWAALQGITLGTTATYAEIASRIGNPGAARAVAGACAANHIAVAIPCHRVVRTGGALSGYRWGVDKKKALLDKEARLTPSPVFRA